MCNDKSDVRQNDQGRKQRHYQSQITFSLAVVGWGTQGGVHSPGSAFPLYYRCPSFSLIYDVFHSRSFSITGLVFLFFYHPLSQPRLSVHPSTLSLAGCGCLKLLWHKMASCDSYLCSVWVLSLEMYSNKTSW